MPIIAPIGVDALGQTYNCNADTAAGAIAGALKAHRLLLLTDVPGVLNKEKKLLPLLDSVQVGEHVWRCLRFAGSTRSLCLGRLLQLSCLHGKKTECCS